MAFVTSRGFDLPEAADQMDGSLWFNLWRNRLWPYNELSVGDDLYWYETPTQRIVWKTRVRQVGSFHYASLDEAMNRIDLEFDGAVDRMQPYLEGKPDEGYCLAYRVNVVERLDLPKPSGVRFNQLGWERTDHPEIGAWLSNAGAPEDAEQGVSNPHWVRDEIVLALDLFVRAGSLSGGPLPGKTEPRVVTLSEQMARLPIHPPHRRGRDFRNPTGVALKIANFRAIDRDVAIDRGEHGAENLPKGMRRYGALDRAIFEEFYEQWDQLHEEAAAILGEASPTSVIAERPAFESRPIEEARVETFDTAPTTGGMRTRREASLVRRYAAWMADQGVAVESHEYAVGGEARPLICDVFVPKLSLLIEAKAHDNRNSVRMAIGQLMDYRRFLDRPRLAILLPHEPAIDHQDLLRSVEIGWIWPDREGRFFDSHDGELTGPPSG